MADRIDEQPVVAPVATPAPAVAPAPAPSPTPSPEPATAAAVQADQPAVVSAASGVANPSGDPGAAVNPDAPPKTDGLGPTLLQEFDASKEKPAEAKPVDPAAPKPVVAEVKPVEGAKPVEAPVQAAPAELPAVDYWKDVVVPETIRIADNQRTEVNGALDLIRNGKASEGVGKLVGLHEQAMKDYAAAVQKDQWNQFRETNKAWRLEVEADPQLGGSGIRTAMAAVARMRDMAVSRHKAGTPEYEADYKSFDHFLTSTGAGNHPAFLRMMHNFARAFDEPAMPPADIKPATGNGRAPGDRRGRMYPSMQKGT